MSSLAVEGLGDIDGLLPAGFDGPMFAMFAMLGAAPGGSPAIAPGELGLARFASSSFANWSSSPPISGLSAGPSIAKGFLVPFMPDPGPDLFPPASFGALPPDPPFGPLLPGPPFTPLPPEPLLFPPWPPDRDFEDEETTLDDDDLVDFPLPSLALPGFELRLQPLESFRLEFLRSLPDPEPAPPSCLPCLLPEDLPLAAEPAAEDEPESPDLPLIILAAS